MNIKNESHITNCLDQLNYQFLAKFRPLFVLGVALQSCSKLRRQLTAGLALRGFAKVASGKALSNLATAAHTLVKE